MAKTINWDSRIGRRVRLRDLHVLFAVIENRSMAKAGAHLGMSQSAVSQAIAALEHALRVRLLDRTSRGVEPTLFGSALLRRGRAAFDELRLGVKEIESLVDPTAGEVRISCSESISAGILPPIIDRFSQRYPRIRLHVLETGSALVHYPELQERKADVRFAMPPRPIEGDLAKEFSAEILFYDRICLAAGASSPWARRRKIDLAELANEPWIMPSLEAPGGAAIAETFRARGLPLPQMMVTTLSVHLRGFLGKGGRFVVALPSSILEFYADLFALKKLPIELPMAMLPFTIVTLKDRTLGPAVELFIACAREVTQSLREDRGKRRASRHER
jgi:DNA-binding transcriptional LysR family regulator